MFNYYKHHADKAKSAKEITSFKRPLSCAPVNGRVSGVSLHRKIGELAFLKYLGIVICIIKVFYQKGAAIAHCPSIALTLRHVSITDYI